MGDIKKSTKIISAPVTVPEEGPVISSDEVVTTTSSSTTVKTVTKRRAEVNDETTGKQVTRDTTTTVRYKGKMQTKNPKNSQSKRQGIIYSGYVVRLYPRACTFLKGCCY